MRLRKNRLVVCVHGVEYKSAVWAGFDPANYYDQQWLHLPGGSFRVSEIQWAAVDGVVVIGAKP